MFIINPIIFYQTLTFGTIISKVSLTVALFALCMTLAIMLEYIGGLHRRMKIKNTENVRLLDGMHEGLLIVSKTQKDIMFCNKPAQKLFQGEINKIMQRFDSKETSINPLIQPKIFQPVKIAVKDQVKKFLEMVNEENQ